MFKISEKYNIILQVYNVFRSFAIIQKRSFPENKFECFELLQFSNINFEMQF